MTDAIFEELMDSGCLDDEYWDYVVQHGAGEILLHEDAIYKAIESGKYYEGFKEFVMSKNQTPVPSGSTYGHDYPACGLIRGGKCTCDLATNVETITYSDGTKATGLAPLPEESPATA